MGIKYERAEVVSIISETLEPDPDFQYINIGKQEVELKILKGENKGKIHGGKSNQKIFTDIETTTYKKERKQILYPGL